jgi:hypothetical protein
MQLERVGIGLYLHSPLDNGSGDFSVAALDRNRGRGFQRGMLALELICQGHRAGGRITSNCVAWDLMLVDDRKADSRKN